MALPTNEPRWKEICDFVGWNPNGPLKPMLYHGYIIPHSKGLGIGPRFLNELREKINNIEAIRMLIVGPAGKGKTYTAIHIARILDPKFSIEQVVFSGKDYINLARTLKPRRCMVLEEPTFMLAARTWMKEWQQIVVRTIESTRFQNNPLFVPVVNRNLVDKTVREYYVNYVIVMFERGRGRVYRTKHSQWIEKFFRETAFELYVYTPALELAQCGRTTCLYCPELATCNKFIWPQYERKRAEMIEFYQKESEEVMAKRETEQLGEDQLEKMAYKLIGKLIISQKGRVDMDVLQIVFKDEYGIPLSAQQAKTISKRLMYHYPAELEGIKNKRFRGI